MGNPLDGQSPPGKKLNLSFFLTKNAILAMSMSNAMIEAVAQNGLMLSGKPFLPDWEWNELPQLGLSLMGLITYVYVSMHPLWKF